jgi:hypothetical protein
MGEAHQGGGRGLWVDLRPNRSRYDIHRAALKRMIEGAPDCRPPFGRLAGAPDPLMRSTGRTFKHVMPCTVRSQ